MPRSEPAAANHADYASRAGSAAGGRGSPGNTKGDSGLLKKELATGGRLALGFKPFWPLYVSKETNV
jgi:hypothetical protein